MIQQPFPLEKTWVPSTIEWVPNGSQVCRGSGLANDWMITVPRFRQFRSASSAGCSPMSFAISLGGDVADAWYQNMISRPPQVDKAKGNGIQHLSESCYVGFGRRECNNCIPIQPNVFLVRLPMQQHDSFGPWASHLFQPQDNNGKHSSSTLKEVRSCDPPRPS